MRIGEAFYNTKLQMKGVCKGKPTPRGTFRAELEDGTVRHVAVDHCKGLQGRKPMSDEEKMQRQLTKLRAELARERQRRIQLECEAEVGGGMTTQRPHEPHATERDRIEKAKAEARRSVIAAGLMSQEYSGRQIRLNRKSEELNELASQVCQVRGEDG